MAQLLLLVLSSPSTLETSRNTGLWIGTVLVMLLHVLIYCYYGPMQLLYLKKLKP